MVVTAASSSGLHLKVTDVTGAFRTQLYIIHVFNLLLLLLLFHFFYILPLLLPVGPPCFQHFELNYHLIGYICSVAEPVIGPLSNLLPVVETFLMLY